MLFIQNKKSMLVSVILLAILAFFSVAVSSYAYADTADSDDDSTTSEEVIKSKLSEIGDKYSEGDILSDEDAAYVRAHVPEVGDSTESQLEPAALNQSGKFSKTKKKFGTTVHVSGSIFSKYEGLPTEHSYGGTIAVKKTAGKTPRKIKTTITCRAYGLMGTKLLVMYNGSVSASKKNADSLKAQLKKTYTGVVAYCMVEASVSVTTSNGDVFTVSD
ncbi:MAG: hypothetical protein Q4A43_03090 [Coriobacteriia bacterium]|nr:hypothetical protein [Coriobacteriia bacterium]